MIDIFKKNLYFAAVLFHCPKVTLNLELTECPLLRDWILGFTSNIHFEMCHI